MLRARVAIGMVLFFGGPTAALGQQLGQGPAMPIATNLAKVPPGCWAEYSVTMGQLPPMKMRMALVGRSAAGNVVESTVQGGMMTVNLVIQMTLSPGSGTKLKKAVMQLGTNDPMVMPVGLTGSAPFTKPNPKGLVGTETIKTPAGSFKTKHYRDKSPRGDNVEYWVDESVLPFGLVKVAVDQTKDPPIGKSTFELTAIGNGAKPSITKPAKPFDQAAVIQQAGAGAGGAAKPAPAPAAAPAPKK